MPEQIRHLWLRNGIKTSVALGSNWDHETIHTNKPELNLVSKMTAMTSLLMYLSGLTKEVILTGGKTAGETNPSEAAAMKAYLERHSGLTLPFLVEEDSKDT